MTGGKAPPGTDGVLPNRVAAEIEAKSAGEAEAHATDDLPRRSTEEADPPLGAKRTSPQDAPPEPGE